MKGTSISSYRNYKTKAAYCGLFLRLSSVNRFFDSKPIYQSIFFIVQLPTLILLLLISKQE
ncbi:hypothetical protein VPHK24_0077 [Vibrio phage K24]